MSLTEIEYGVLAYLVEHADRVLTLDAICSTPGVRPMWMRPSMPGPMSGGCAPSWRTIPRSPGTCWPREGLATASGGEPRAGRAADPLSGRVSSPWLQESTHFLHFCYLWFTFLCYNFHWSPVLALGWKWGLAVWRGRSGLGTQNPGLEAVCPCGT